MKRPLSIATLAVLVGCVPPAPEPAPPTWNAVSDAAEAEYAPFLKDGTASLTGQAFMVQSGGGTVKAAGRNVTLDPATSVGNEWWGKAGTSWRFRALTPPSPGFQKAHRTVVADADGRFTFKALPAGRYYLRTEVTWDAGAYYGAQGGLTGHLVEIKDGQAVEVILNDYAK